LILALFSVNLTSNESEHQNQHSNYYRSRRNLAAGTKTLALGTARIDLL